MPRVPLEIVGQSYEMPAIQLDAQTCINWYPVSDPTGKFPSALFPIPGMKVWAEDDNNFSVRGMFRLNEVLYVVIDNSFRLYNTNGDYEEKGTLTSSNGNVRMIANDFQIFLTDGEKGYVYQVVKSSLHDAGEFFEVTEIPSDIGAPVFEGAGLDDLITRGDFIGTEDATYRIEIDFVGTGLTDSFRWSDSDGETWNEENVDISFDYQTLNNGVQIKFAHRDGHTLNDQWTFKATIDSTFYVPIIPVYQDNYGIYIKQVSNIFYISAINEFSQVNALDSARTIAFPDNLVAGISLREEIWFLCRDSIEIWYNTGAAAFPFQRRNNLVMSYGCAAAYSVAFGDNNILFWLGRNTDGGRVALMAAGYQIKIISTEPINAELESYSRVDDAFGFVQQWDGHIFYVLTFPTADRTWVYDMTLNMWHERRSRFENEERSSAKYRQGRWRANNFAYFADKHLVGDFQSGKIYELSRNEYTENGIPITCERTVKNIQQTLSRIFINSLQLDFQAGVGLTQGQGSDPQIMLQVSKDDGVSWGNELWRSLGEIGEYKTRVKWNRLGAARSFVFRVRSTDPVYRVLLGAVADIEVAAS